MAIPAYAFVLLQAQAGSLYPDVTVLSSDERGLTIEFRPRFLAEEKISAEGSEYLLPRFEYGFNSITTDAGKEDIRTRIISTALPGFRGNAVSVIASDFETISNFSLAPVPQISAMDSMGTVQKKYKPQFIAGQRYYPQDIVSLKDIAVIKGVIAGNIVVTPFQYQSSTKTLRKYSRIVIRIEYGVKENVFSDSKNDEWAQVSLINYPAAKKWMRQQALRKAAAIDSKLAHGRWYKIEVVEDGMYKIDASYLRSIGEDPSTLTSITDVEVFGSDGKRIPENITAPRPADLPQMAVYYADRDGDSKFDDDDYILFYGQGVTGWTTTFNIFRRSDVHYTNCYTNSNYYFIGIGTGAPAIVMQEATAEGNTSAKVTSTTAKLFFEEEKFNFNQSGQNWVSVPFNPGESRVISNKLHGWISGTPVAYDVYLYSRAVGSGTFLMEESGVQIGSASIGGFRDESYLNDPQYPFAYGNNNQFTVVPNLDSQDPRSNLKFTYTSSSNSALGFIDWVEILYRRHLSAVNDELIFDSPDSSEVVEYQVDGFTAPADVFEVSNVNNVRKLAGDLTDVAGVILFKDSLSATVLKKYWVGTPAAYRYPKSFVKLPNSNLRGYNGAEFIIITHSEFKSEALRLKSHKESLPRPLSTVVIDVDTIYNEFGIGMPDPVAMRDFLKYAVDNWTVKPGYVLFFGDASYDYKSILGNDKSWVPTFQTAESNDKINSFNIEDFFSYLSSSSTVSIAHGRLCPRSAGDAAFLVNRIINYETKQYAGGWKNTITIVGDDVWTPENQHETEHTTQADRLASLPALKAYEVKKIYLGEYTTLYTSSGRSKPDARQAIINQINNGTVLINYTGHGNPKVWAHEAILTIDDVKSQLTNDDRLTFIVAATCDWGRFDEAGEQSSAEEALVNKKGGGIGVFSATRAVYSGPNFEINSDFYHQLFDPINPLRLGDIVMLTKRGSDNLVNAQKYFLLGDPTIVLAIPKMKLSIDSINDRSTLVVDTLRSLEKVTIKATVRDTSGLPATNYNGTALVTVYDSDRLRSFTEMPESEYSENGAVIYRGENTISNGELKATFIVPKDITYENKNGRISIYFSNALSDGRGYTTNFVVGGTSDQAGSDSTGPVLSIFFDTPSFRSGDVVTENPTLIIELKDSNGINSSGSAIGHRVEAWIDGSPNSIDMTEYYKGKIDSYQEGTVEYKLSSLSPGSHSIKVRAWDVYNNSSTAESYFVVASGEGLSIYNAYNFPNPVSTSTVFTFQYNLSTSIDVTIRLYTVTGRLIHTIERHGWDERFFRVMWDRRDRDGDEVGNGIYLYKITAKTVDGKYSSEALGKLAIVR